MSLLSMYYWLTPPIKYLVLCILQSKSVIKANNVYLGLLAI